jgi:hypothetical protein
MFPFRTGLSFGRHFPHTVSASDNTSNFYRVIHAAIEFKVNNLQVIYFLLDRRIYLVDAV